MADARDPYDDLLDQLAGVMPGHPLVVGVFILVGALVMPAILLQIS